MQMLKIPQWLTARIGDDDMSESYPMMPPAVATIPPPLPDDDDRTAIVKAAAVYDEIKRREEDLQVQLTEALLSRQTDRQKIGFLEKESAELHLEIARLQNTIATLQADVMDKDKFMSLVRQVLDKYGIKPPPKKPRPPRRKKEIVRHEISNATATAPDNRPTV